MPFIGDECLYRIFCVYALSTCLHVHFLQACRELASSADGVKYGMMMNEVNNYVTFRDSTDAKNISLVEHLFDTYVYFPLITYTLKKYMTPPRPRDIEDKVMNSFNKQGDYRLYVRDDQNRLVLNMTAHDVLKTVLHECDLREYHFPVREWVALHIGIDDRLSKSFGDLFHASKDITSIVEPQIVALRKLLIDGWSAVGTDYASDLKPLIEGLLTAMKAQGDAALAVSKVLSILLLLLPLPIFLRCMLLNIAGSAPPAAPSGTPTGGGRNSYFKTDTVPPSAIASDASRLSLYNDILAQRRELAHEYTQAGAKPTDLLSCRLWWFIQYLLAWCRRCL